MLLEKYRGKIAYIPVFINCRDLYKTTRSLTEWFCNKGFKRIYLIDNQSSYQPLLNWYSELGNLYNGSVTLLRLNKNSGHTALWKENLLSKYAKNEPFFYTDPDVIPLDECRDNFAEKMLGYLDKYPEFNKVSFEIKNDDFPDFYPDKQICSKYLTYLKKEKKEDNLYVSANDTTLALYRPNAKHHFYSLMMGEPYAIKHIPWYIDPDNLDEDFAYYVKNAKTNVTNLNAKQRTSNLYSDIIKRLDSGETIKDVFQKEKGVMAKLKRSIKKRLNF